MPELIIIAGPNGAGKSSNSSVLLEDYQIKAFDYDEEFYSRWQAFSYDPLVEQGVRDYVSDLFISYRDAAIVNNLHFAFETNYHTSEISNTVSIFKRAGFTCRLILFFCQQFRMRSSVLNQG